MSVVSEPEETNHSTDYLLLLSPPASLMLTPLHSGNLFSIFFFNSLLPTFVGFPLTLLEKDIELHSWKFGGESVLKLEADL